MKFAILFLFSKVSQLDVRHSTKQNFFVHSYHPEDSNSATILLFCEMITLGSGKKIAIVSNTIGQAEKCERAAKKSTQKRIANWQTREYQNTKAYEIGPYFCHSFIVSFVSLRSRFIPCRHFSFDVHTMADRTRKQYLCNI